MTFNGIILPISIVMGLLVFGLAAKWYVAPALAGLDRKTALTPFLLFHGTRYIGLAFLISGVTAEPLDPRFAGPAAYGDLLAAALALVALLALRLDWPIAPYRWCGSSTSKAPLTCSTPSSRVSATRRRVISGQPISSRRSSSRPCW